LLILEFLDGCSLFYFSLTCPKHWKFCRFPSLFSRLSFHLRICDAKIQGHNPFCLNKSKSSQSANKRSIEIDKMLKEYKKDYFERTQIIFFHLPHSGGKTIFQNLILTFHHKEKLPHVLAEYARIIRINLQGLRRDLLYIAKRAKIEIDETEQDEWKKLQNIWLHPCVQQKYLRLYYLTENSRKTFCVEYFLENHSRFLSSEFVPTKEDILKCRIPPVSHLRTLSFLKRVVRSDTYHFPFYHNEVLIQKIALLFSHLNAIVFTISLLDWFVKEQKEIEEMLLQIRYVALIISLHSKDPMSWFPSHNSGVVMYLTYVDAFRERVKANGEEFLKRNPDFEGSLDAKSLQKWIQRKIARFVDSSPIYFHFGCGIDQNSLRLAFRGILDICLHCQLRSNFS